MSRSFLNSLSPPTATSIPLDSLKYIAVFAAFFLLSLAGFKNAEPHSPALIMPSSALLLYFLMQRPVRKWPAYLTISLLAHLSFLSIYGDRGSAHPHSDWVILTAQCMLGAGLMKRISQYIGEFTFNRLSGLLTFTCAGVMFPVALGGLISASLELPHGQMTFWTIWHQWWSICCLNNIALTPLFFAATTRISFPPPIRIGQKLTIGFYAVILISFSILWIMTASPGCVYATFLVLLLVAMKYEFHGIAVANLLLMSVVFTYSNQVAELLVTHYSIIQEEIYLNQSLGLFCIATLSVSSALSEKRIAQAETKSNLLRYHYLIENTSDFMVILDPELRLICGNNAWRQAIGHDGESISRYKLRNLVHPADRTDWDRVAQNLLNQVQPGKFEVRLLTPHGKIIHIEGSFELRQEAGVITEIYSILRDVSERKLIEEKNLEHQKQLEAANSKLRSLSITDSLTQVYNRRFFQQRLEEEFSRCQRYHSPMALLIIDLDHFKHINDTYGHQVGDRALCKVASKITQSVRSNDLVARYGGEEFSVLLPITEIHQAAISAERIRQAIQDAAWPHNELTVSIGVAAISEQTGSIEELIHQADQALYCAKKSGRNQVNLFDPLSRTSLMFAEEKCVDNLSKH